MLYEIRLWRTKAHHTAVTATYFVTQERAMAEYGKMDPFSFAGSKDVDYPVCIRMYTLFK